MRCKELKKNNQQCQANAMIGDKFCYLHNPEISKEDKIFYQSKGGRANTIKANLPLEQLEISEPKDSVTLIVQTINELRSGKIEVRMANCLGVLSGHLVRAFELIDLEQRLRKLEQAVNDNITTF